uniref:Uncharacterized protein n=1 Tax=Oryctolagus cuniculus TaxID=9986 RepID=A0A5F9DAZ7_RABIT
MCECKAVIQNVDMPEEMQQDLAARATPALEKRHTEKDVVAPRKESDERCNLTGHLLWGGTPVVM